MRMLQEFRDPFVEISAEEDLPQENTLNGNEMVSAAVTRVKKEHKNQ